MKYELQFLVMVDSFHSLEEFVSILKRNLSDSKTFRSRSFDWKGNWIQIEQNEDYNPVAATNPKDGFLFYKFRIEVSPTEDYAHDLQHQIALAKEIEAIIQNRGGKAVVCADFEELLEKFEAA